ncbi:MAG: primosomal protein N' [Chloroflexi bacterium]|nr:primosomal protein N' [Chloroflexota bacterium]
MFAEIVVNAPLSRRRVPFVERTEGFAALAQTFTYSIPPALEGRLQPGHLVTVPFGPRKLQGIVVALSAQTAVEKVKDVFDLVDPLPVLSAAQVALAQWMSDTYFAPLIDCVLQMFPPGLESEVQTLIVLNPNAPDGVAGDNAAQQALLERLQRDRQAPLDDLVKGASKTETLRAIDSLVRKGLASKQSVLLPPRARAQTERTVRLIAEPTPELLQAVKGDRQKAVLQYLVAQGGLSAVKTVREVRDATHAPQDTLATLERANYIRVDQRETFRDPLRGMIVEPAAAPDLTPDQQTVWDAIRPALDGAEPASTTFLLHGVTGSGKTEIYLRAVAETIARSRQAIVLVPEIALTPQTIRRFAARFGSRVTIAHSQLGLGERYDQWRRMRAGAIDVVVGPRSAVFAPLPRLGLIVLDEEHEGSYKQDRAPHYHARETARQYAALCGATVILGSATPSLESMFQARQGAYRLLTLPQRIETRLPGAGPQAAAINRQPLIVNLELPHVDIVDMRAELKAGNTSIFSRALRDALSETLEARQQAILFLNRRGAATFVMCRDCGHVLKCRRCDNALTYHSDESELICHHCGRRYGMPALCPACGSKRIRQFGAGTQKVEEVVSQLFPTARTLRWDRDVTGARGAHDELLRRFASHEADVLIGTQMIAKGLDLPLVTLVGAVSADTGLNLPDFRAGERTFQLLTQVAGRAGRSRLSGRAILQTYMPGYPVITAAARHDYAAFYEAEIEFRRRLHYPPFSRLIRLIFAGAPDARVQSEAESLHRNLSQRVRQLGLAGLEIIGPAPCFNHKLRGMFRWQVIVKGANPHALLRAFNLPVGWHVDVDPVSVL